MIFIAVWIRTFTKNSWYVVLPDPGTLRVNTPRVATDDVWTNTCGYEWGINQRVWLRIRCKPTRAYRAGVNRQHPCWLDSYPSNCFPLRVQSKKKKKKMPALGERRLLLVALFKWVSFPSSVSRMRLVCSHLSLTCTYQVLRLSLKGLRSRWQIPGDRGNSESMDLRAYTVSAGMILNSDWRCCCPLSWPRSTLRLSRTTRSDSISCYDSEPLKLRIV